MPDLISRLKSKLKKISMSQDPRIRAESNLSDKQRDAESNLSDKQRDLIYQIRAVSENLEGMNISDEAKSKVRTHFEYVASIFENYNLDKLKYEPKQIEAYAGSNLARSGLLSLGRNLVMQGLSREDARTVKKQLAEPLDEAYNKYRPMVEAAVEAKSLDTSEMKRDAIERLNTSTHEDEHDEDEHGGMHI